MTTPQKAPFDERKMLAWLRDSQEGRTLVAKVAAEKGPRITSEILDSTPPNNLDAEMGLIGSVLLDLKTHATLIAEIPAMEFYSDAHKAIWREMQSIMKAGKPPDATLLAEYLKRAGQWNAVGGAAYIAEILHGVAVAAHAGYYAEIVREKAQLRKAIRAACDVLRACYDTGASLEHGGAVRKAAMALLEIMGI